jgi:hypothetical protein
MQVVMGASASPGRSPFAYEPRPIPSLTPSRPHPSAHTHRLGSSYVEGA